MWVLISLSAAYTYYSSDAVDDKLSSSSAICPSICKVTYVLCLCMSNGFYLLIWVVKLKNQLLTEGTIIHCKLS